jgi:hypothetical protein
VAFPVFAPAHLPFSMFEPMCSWVLVAQEVFSSQVDWSGTGSCGTCALVSRFDRRLSRPQTI